MKKTDYDIVSTESGDYKTTLNKMYRQRRAWEPINPKHIVSFMPGMVEQFKVKVGDKVKKGDCLMVFKAMKMNNKMLSPFDGVIKSINVSANENLPKNVVLMEFE